MPLTIMGGCKSCESGRVGGGGGGNGGYSGVKVGKEFVVEVGFGGGFSSHAKT